MCGTSCVSSARRTGPRRSSATRRWWRRRPRLLLRRRLLLVLLVLERLLPLELQRVGLVGRRRVVDVVLQRVRRLDDDVVRAALLDALVDERRRAEATAVLEEVLRHVVGQVEGARRPV